MNHNDGADTPFNSFVVGKREARNAPARVADVMTKDAVTLRPEQSFADAVSLMADRHVRHILVVDSNQHVTGVISDRDILRALARVPNWQAMAISGVMMQKVFTVGPDVSLSVAASEMLKRRINCLPVVAKDGTLCGILTSTDLLKRYQQLEASLG